MHGSSGMITSASPDRPALSSRVRYCSIVEAVLVVVLVLAVVAASAVAVTRRRAVERDVKAASDRSKPPHPSQRALPERIDSDEVIIVPPSDSAEPALVIGGAKAIETLERAGLARPPGRSNPFSQAIQNWGEQQEKARRADWERVANQPLEGRWMQLTEESARRMKEGGSIVRSKTGDMLGMLNDAKGNRDHNLRFVGGSLVAAPGLALAAANLQATLALQAQLEEIEERLSDIQETLATLAKDIDTERLARVAAAAEMLQDVAEQVRRRGRMRPSDWDRAVEAELDLRSAVKQAGWSLGEITKDVPDARSRRRRVEVLEQMFMGGRLEYWLTVFADVQLAMTRWDLIYLLHEATEYPDELGNLEQTVRQAVARRQRDLYVVGATLRDTADPTARRFLDHLQQISHLKLRTKRGLVTELLARHSDAFPETDPVQVSFEAEQWRVERRLARLRVLRERAAELEKTGDQVAFEAAQRRVGQLERELNELPGDLVNG